MPPFDPTQLTSTPFGAPLVPSLPIRLRRTEILTVVYRCFRAALERFIPEPLVLADELCVLHVYWMHDAEWFGVYGESAVELRPNAQVPVHLLPVGEIILGLHRIMDVTLPPATMVHRYS